jgi:hypothetical protein
MKLLSIILTVSIFTTTFLLTSSGDDEIIKTIISNEVAAKDRLDSANAQAKRTYGDSTELVLILERMLNQMENGNIRHNSYHQSDSIGAWLYVFRARRFL